MGKQPYSLKSYPYLSHKKPREWLQVNSLTNLCSPTKWCLDFISIIFLLKKSSRVLAWFFNWHI